MDSITTFALLAVTYVVIALSSGAWAYGDAKRRGRSGILWLLIVFCMFPVGPVLWLFSRPRRLSETSFGDSDEELKKKANSGLL
jgi:hypothetical protein